MIHSELKSYYCPHCEKVIMKGDVKKLNMPCPYCQKMINADEVDLLGTGYIKTNKNDIME